MLEVWHNGSAAIIVHHASLGLRPLTAQPGPQGSLRNREPSRSWSGINLDSRSREPQVIASAGGGSVAPCRVGFLAFGYADW